MKRILLLLIMTAVMALVFASAALAESHPLPSTGGPALLPLVGILAVSLGLSGVAYLRRKR